MYLVIMAQRLSDGHCVGALDRWFKPLPMDLTAQLVEERRVFFHTAIDYDPWWCIGPKSVSSSHALSHCPFLFVYIACICQQLCAWSDLLRDQAIKGDFVIACACSAIWSCSWFRPAPLFVLCNDQALPHAWPG